MTLKCYSPTAPKPSVPASKGSASPAGAVTASPPAAPPAAGAAGAQLHGSLGRSAGCWLLCRGSGLERAPAHLFPVIPSPLRVPLDSISHLHGSRCSSAGGGFGGQWGAHSGVGSDWAVCGLPHTQGSPQPPLPHGPPGVPSGVGGQGSLRWGRSEAAPGGPSEERFPREELLALRQRCVRGEFSLGT